MYYISFVLKPRLAVYASNVVHVNNLRSGTAAPEFVIWEYRRPILMWRAPLPSFDSYLAIIWIQLDNSLYNTPMKWSASEEPDTSAGIGNRLNGDHISMSPTKKLKTESNKSAILVSVKKEDPDKEFHVKKGDTSSSGLPSTICSSTLAKESVISRRLHLEEDLEEDSSSSDSDSNDSFNLDKYENDYGIDNRELRERFDYRAYSPTQSEITLKL